MVSKNDVQASTVALRVSKPVTIYSGMNLQDWKKCFVQKKNEATNSTEAHLYNKFIKLLLWAEFCDATITYTGNAKDNEGNFTFKFTFVFPNSICLSLFQANWESNLGIFAES